MDRNVISKLARDVHTDAWIVGIDEAGRGPVLGPMVYAAAYCPVAFEPKLSEMYGGVADSKTLTPEQRQTHLQTLRDTAQLGMLQKSQLACHCSIQRGPCRVPTSLNLVALESTIQLLNALVRQKIAIEHVYVDTLGKPMTHQKRLQTAFPDLQITVRAKADVLFPIVSLASIVAKVLRDEAIEDIQSRSVMPVGCGYPSDAITQRWLKSTLDPIFGFSQDIRFSWSTCSNLLDKGAVKVIWNEKKPKQSTLMDCLVKLEDRQGTSFFHNRKLETIREDPFQQERCLKSVHESGVSGKNGLAVSECGSVPE